MKLIANGDVIAGEVYYSSGTRAGAEWIEITDQTAPGAVQTFQARNDGRFEYRGKAGHYYLVKAIGEEGHEIAMEITLDGQARGQMIEEGDATFKDDSSSIPAWLLLGAVLLLSALPALWLVHTGKNRSVPPRLR